MACVTRQPTLPCPKLRAAMPSFRLSSLKLPTSSSTGDQNHLLHKPTTESSPLQKISSGPNSRSLSAAVIRLKKAELAQELQLRGLPDTGTRQDLRARLLEVVEDDQRVATGPSTQPDVALQEGQQPHQSQPQPTAHSRSANASLAQAQQPHVQPQQPPSGSRQPGAVRLRQHQNIKQNSSTDTRHASPQSAADLMPSAANMQTPSPQTTPAQSSNLTPASHMSVTWLGTSSGSPSMRRNVSSIALCHGRSTHLVDCGEGTSRQILRSHINPASITGIYISHLHGDHCFGLPGVIELVSRAHIAAEAERGSCQLTIQGPPGVQQLVKSALAGLQVCTGSELCSQRLLSLLMASLSSPHMRLLVRDYTLDRAQAKDPTPVDPTGLISFARQAPDADSEPQTNPKARTKGFRNKHSNLQAHNIPVVPGLAWTAQCEGGMTVTAAQLQHRLPCWGYVFQEGPVQEQPGRKVVLLGDTCDSQAIIDAGMGADMVSHECTFAAGMEKKAYVAQHSTAPMAGAFARRVRARALVLTHFSNRYSNRAEIAGQEYAVETEGDRQDVLQWLMDQAKEAYGSSNVWAANDFYTFDIKHQSRFQTSKKLR